MPIGALKICGDRRRSESGTDCDGHEKDKDGMVLAREKKR